MTSPAAASDTIPSRDDEVEAAVVLASDGIKPADRIRGIQQLAALIARPDVIRAQLGADSPKVRSAAAFNLGTFGEPGDQERLEVLTNDPNSAVRRSACLALGVGHFGSAAEGLRAIAVDDTESMRVRTAALESLARLTVKKDKESVADLVCSDAGEPHTFPPAEGYRALALLDAPGARSRLKASANKVVGGRPATPSELKALTRAIQTIKPQDEESERLGAALAGMLPPEPKPGVTSSAGESQP